MAYSLAEAAIATGKVKSTIFKACKNGKISYTKDDNGQFSIEPSELHRVFPPVAVNVEFSAEKETKKTIRNAEFSAGNGIENRLLEQEVKFLREKLSDLERLNENERRSLSERVEDLRGERDRLLKVIEEQAGSMKLLADQRVKKEEPGRGLWKRLFG